MYTIEKTIFAATILLFAFSCENVQNPEPIDAIDSTKTATIEGVAYANMDESNDDTGDPDEDYEYAPEGTIVKVVLDSEDFARNNVPGVDYQNLNYTTTVGGSGEYSVEVPALDEEVTAEIHFDEFREDQVQADGSSEERIFRVIPSPFSVTVVADLKSYNDVFYSDN
jgi:hypothetical protein